MLPRIFTNRCPVVQWKRRIILQTSVGIHYGFSQLRKLLDPHGKHCIFLQSTLSVRLNMSPSDNGLLPLTKRPIRSRISSERWEQIKVAYVFGIGLREIARKMNIPEGTVLAHAKRHGWTQQIQIATQQQSDAITPVQSVADVLQEHERETKLSLARSARRMAKDAEQATLREAPYVHKLRR